MSNLAKSESDGFEILQPEMIENAIEAMKHNQIIGDLDLLDRIRVPTAGGNAFLIPGLEGDESFKDFNAIILGFNDHRLFFKQSYDETGGGVKPDCLSNDMIEGIGDPGGPCDKCPKNEWESAEKGKGKACVQKRNFLLLLPNQMIPVKLDAPPTSLQNLRKYFLRLASFSCPFNKVITNFSLSKDKNDKGIEYSKIEVKMQKKLSDIEVKSVLDFSNALIK